MKFLHLSDLHIGLKLMNHNMKEDQEYILEQIVREAEFLKPDAVIIAGDLYDKAVPSAEAVEVFDHFLSKLAETLPEAEIMMISGNHDSARRIDLYRSILGTRKIHMIGLPPAGPEDHIEKVTLRDSYGNVNFYLLPFVKPSMVRDITGTGGNNSHLSYNEAVHMLIARETIESSERNVLVSHQFYLPAGRNPEEIDRMDSEIRTVGNIDAVKADILELFDYAALGHIHKPMKAGDSRYRYSGTPMACSVSEAGQQKGMILVELGEKGNVETEVIPLKPLREIRVIRGTLEEVLLQGCEDYTTVILTDQADLDVIDMQERIRHHFPYLLEIRRQTAERPDYGVPGEILPELSAFELCVSFLNNPSEEEQLLLRDVINTVQEAGI